MAHVVYPRTGKRGVPQQFPRRLYEMLEKEAKLHSTPNNESDAIAWSDSGRAFRITDVESFSAKVLPKYFRTSKFSSFQRNLNLYGFTKVRRGPETDMYAHPAFVRGQADNLADLRKSSSTSRRRPSKGSEIDSTGSNESPVFRPVSPSSCMEVPPSVNFFQPATLQMTPCPTPSQLLSQAWITFNTRALSSTQNIAATMNAPVLPVAQIVPSSSAAAIRTVRKSVSPPRAGRLDLLALALEREDWVAN